jgi:PTH1 family peptidyl-tRNA hydrolase
MKIVAGLGNPGTKYEFTRHNAGFMAIDYFMKDKTMITCQSKFNAQVGEYHENGVKVLFIKPQSYMNLSGKVIRDITEFYKINVTTDLLVVHDDKDLVFGQIKYGSGSGAGGHNGVQNIIDELGTKNFARIRIGIESRESNSPILTDEFVLQKFTDEELQQLNNKVFNETSQLIKNFLKS